MNIQFDLLLAFLGLVASSVPYLIDLFAWIYANPLITTAIGLPLLAVGAFFENLGKRKA